MVGVEEVCLEDVAVEGGLGQESSLEGNNATLAGKDD